MEVGEEEERVEDGAGEDSIGSQEETGWVSSSIRSSSSLLVRLQASLRSRSVSS